ncbi:MAG: hypothetical protein NC098_07980 [Lachnoclostridium sp.]|nr:hypothetical protein [Lachnoclostridium sp.]
MKKVILFFVSLIASLSMWGQSFSDFVFGVDLGTSKSQLESLVNRNNSNLRRTTELNGIEYYVCDVRTPFGRPVFGLKYGEVVIISFSESGYVFKSSLNDDNAFGDQARAEAENYESRCMDLFQNAKSMLQSSIGRGTSYGLYEHRWNLPKGTVTLKYSKDEFNGMGWGNDTQINWRTVLEYK